MPVRLPVVRGELWTLTEAARQLKVHRTTLQRAIKRGLLPAIRIGKIALIPPQAAKEWHALFYRQHLPRRKAHAARPKEVTKDAGN